MARLCDDLEPFMEGALEPERADAFRAHLPDCARCQAGLTDLLQLNAVGRRYTELKGGRIETTTNVTVLPFRAMSRTRMAGAGALLAAGIAVVVVLASRRGPGPDVWMGEQASRLTEGRTAYARADSYRPQAGKAMGGDANDGDLPLKALADLQERGDLHGIAAAYLVRNRPDDALKYLERLPPTPEVLNDRALARLQKREPEEALRLLDGALDKAPELAQAKWNRALALRDLGLTMLSAEAFRQGASKDAPGWTKEAAQQAEVLASQVQDRKRRWTEAIDAAEALVKQDTRPRESLFRTGPPILRLYFYDALAACASEACARGLLPVALELDGRAGGEVLRRLVEKVASADMARRKPLAEAYVRLVRGSPPASERDARVAELVSARGLAKAAGNEDVLLGLMARTRTAGAHLATFETLAQRAGDPWFGLLATLERARALGAGAEWSGARRLLETAREGCGRSGVEFRCLEIELELSVLSTTLGDLDAAREHAERGLKAALASGEWGKELQFVESLAQQARFRGDRSLARALLEESLARSGRAPAQVRYVHQSLAMLELEALRFDAARTEINRALGSGQPLSLVGALVLTGISRVRPADGDEAAVRAAISAVSSPGLGEQALAQHLLGRFLVDHGQAQEGRALLRRAIEQADAGGLESRDTNARRARTYSYMTLISAEAKAGAFEAALALFGEELRMPVPASCVLGVSEDDERFVAIARDASGKLVSQFDASRTAPLPQELSGVVGAQVVEALRPCARVVVLSRPPLHGRAGLLPPELAWSYRSRPEEPPAPRGQGSHLVVMDVAINRPGLDPLRGWSPDFGEGERREILAAGEATPSRVLRAMEDATEIDLVTHGVVSSASDASHLVLAPEGDGDALSSARIRQLKLRGEPLVILAACHGGRTGPLQHEPFSLPVAFIQAGARGVIAATVAIPSDREASAFFNAVRARVRGGATPAAALRDERQAWLGGGRGTVWLNSVVLFE